MRASQGVVRGPAIRFTADGRVVEAFAGETLAVALLAAGIRLFRRDQEGRGRGPYCNMGSCYECLVRVSQTAAEPGVRVRACLTPARADMIVRTAAADDL